MYICFSQRGGKILSDSKRGWGWGGYNSRACQLVGEGLDECCVSNDIYRQTRMGRFIKYTTEISCFGVWPTKKYIE